MDKLADFCTVLPEEYKAANATYSSQFVFKISTAWFFTRKIRLAFIEQQEKNQSIPLPLQKQKQPKTPKQTNKKIRREFDQPVFEDTQWEVIPEPH